MLKRTLYLLILGYFIFSLIFCLRGPYLLIVFFRGFKGPARLLRLGGALFPGSSAWAFASGLPGATHGPPGAPSKVLEAGSRLPGGFSLLRVAGVDDDGDEGEFDCHVFQGGAGVPCMQLAVNRGAEHSIHHLQQLLVVLGRGTRPTPPVRRPYNAALGPYLWLWSGQPHSEGGGKSKAG